MSERHTTRRDQWRALWKEDLAASSIPNEMLLDAPGAPEAWAAARAVNDRLVALEDEILASPITSWADIGLLAEIAFSRMWPGCLLDNAEAPTVVSRGPECIEQAELNAIGQLFLAIRQLCRDNGSTGTPPHRDRAGASVKDAAAEIVALVNSRPTSPRQDEIAAIIAKVSAAQAGPGITRTAVLDRLDAALGLAHAAERRLCNAEGKAWDVASVDYDHAFAALRAVEGEIPSPPQSFADVLAWAKIAHFGADKMPDDVSLDLDSEDCFERPAIRLILAVLEWAQDRRLLPPPA